MIIRCFLTDVSALTVLAGYKEGRRPVKVSRLSPVPRCSVVEQVEEDIGQMANPGSPIKWPLRCCMFVCIISTTYDMK